MKNDRIPMIQIDDTIISIDCLSEKFCCDLDACKGECCIEGDAGAPVELDEVAELEEALPVVWPWLSASAQAVIDRQGVVYTDEDGDLVTSIVNGKIVCSRVMTSAVIVIVLWRKLTAKGRVRSTNRCPAIFIPSV